MIVFDKAYNHYLQFAQWTKGKCECSEAIRCALQSLKGMDCFGTCTKKLKVGIRVPAYSYLSSENKEVGF